MKRFDDCLYEAEMLEHENEIKARNARARRYSRKRQTKRDVIFFVICALIASGLVLFTLLYTPAKAETIKYRPMLARNVAVSDPCDVSNDFPETRLRLDDVTVTHYCICEKCCGKKPSDPAYGITASGRRAEAGVSIAVDPELIPLGSTVEVVYSDGTSHFYRADDTGRLIKGKHIDVLCDCHTDAVNAGVTVATVYVGEVY